MNRGSSLEKYNEATRYHFFLCALFGKKWDNPREAIDFERERVNQGIALLKELRYREVLYRRFGLEGYSPQTAQEIAGFWQVSRNRVYQVETQALRKMRQDLNRTDPPSPLKGFRRLFYG